MIKIFVGVAALCCVTLLPAQTLTVLDNITMEPVIGASVFSKMPRPNIKTWGTSTNEFGQADITEIASGDSLYIRHASYGTQGFLMQDVKRMDFTIRLSQREVLLGEVVFSANKTEENKEDVPYTIEVIDQKDVTFGNPQNTGDALQNTGQVFVQRSQMGGSSPVLRGFEASRVLMVVDGVRMNNAIYRSGHLQDCITVDQNMLERTEVIFGPSSTMYGSDALGGTMHFYSKKPIFSSTDTLFVRSNVMARYSSANSEFTEHIDFNIGQRNFASLTSLTYSDFGDLRMGANANPAYGNYDWCREYVEPSSPSDDAVANPDPLVQKFSGYRQVDVTQKFAFRCGDSCLNVINFQFSTSPDGVPRYDRLQQRQNDALRYAEWKYGPQNRLLASYTLSMFKPKNWYDKANVILAFQKIDQDRITRKRNNAFRNTQSEDVYVMSVNIDFAKEKGEHEMRYGAEITHNIVNSTAFDSHVSLGTTLPAETRYADGGSTMSSAAVYFSHSFEISEKLVLSDGIRFTYVTLHSEWADTTINQFPFEATTQSNFSPSGNLGLVYRPGKKLSTHLLLSTGFRAPNVDDMGKVFESSAMVLFIPNPNLKPEMVYGADIGFDLKLGGNAHWTVVGFYSKMVNAMVTKNTQYEGQDSVFYNGDMVQVQSLQNVNDAFITGFSTGLYADFNDHFSFRATVTATYGRYHDAENDTIVPMDHIPPVFGQTGLAYHWRRLEAEIFTRYNGWKHLKDYSPSGEDNLVQASPYGTPAWATINFRATYQVHRFLGVSFACENILDQNYRNFASGISSPGRNFVVALRVHY